MATDYDFRPRYQVPHNIYEGIPDRWGGALQSLTQGLEKGQTAAEALRRKREADMAWGVLSQKFAQDPQMQGIIQVGQAAPDLREKIIPELLKAYQSKESDLMYTPPMAEAALAGNVGEFARLTGNRPIPQKTLSVMAGGQNRKGIQERFGTNLDWRQSVEWQNVAEGFNRDPGVKNARESLAGADKVLRLTNMQSALGDEALGFLVPRALEEVGNLAQAERTAVRISPNIVNRAKSFMQRNIGPGTTLTARDRADLKEIMVAFRKTQQYKLEQLQEYYAGQASENFGVPFNLARKRLGDISKLTVRTDDVVSSMNRGGDNSDIQTMSSEELEKIAYPGGR